MNKPEPTRAERMAHYAALIAETDAMLARHQQRMESEPRWIPPIECPF